MGCTAALAGGTGMLPWIEVYAYKRPWPAATSSHNGQPSPIQARKHVPQGPTTNSSFLSLPPNNASGTEIQDGTYRYPKITARPSQAATRGVHSRDAEGKALSPRMGKGKNKKGELWSPRSKPPISPAPPINKARFRQNQQPTWTSNAKSTRVTRQL